MAEQYGEIEKKLFRQSITVAGVDEVGRGALAGPVYAGAVILSPKRLFALPAAELSLVRDSKALTRVQRSKSVSIVEKIAVSSAVERAETEEIEKLGIVQATFLAMKRAIAKLSQDFGLLLIDGKFPIPDFPSPQKSIIGGDGSCYSIAAASILAKEARDQYMREQAPQFPKYGFDAHVGYATPQHLRALQKEGACSLHRKNFAPMRNSTL